jgi:hypothetical protein
LEVFTHGRGDRPRPECVIGFKRYYGSTVRPRWNGDSLLPLAVPLPLGFDLAQLREQVLVVRPRLERELALETGPGVVTGVDLGRIDLLAFLLAPVVGVESRRDSYSLREDKTSFPRNGTAVAEPVGGDAVPTTRVSAGGGSYCRT